MKKNRIVIHCASGLENIGDETLLMSFVQKYKKTCQITVLCVSSSATSKYVECDRCIDDTDERCKKIIRECDVFVLGGGGLFQDETSIYNVYRWGRYLNYAIERKKKTMIYANSIGPLNYKWNRWYVAKILKKVDIITLRDRESQDELKRLQIEHAMVTADGVFGLKVDKINKMAQYKKPYVCLIIRHWFDNIPIVPVSLCKKYNLRSKKNQKKYARFIDVIVQIVNSIYETYHYQIVLLPFMKDRDFKIANEIKSRVYNSENKLVVVDERNFGIYQYISIIKEAEFVIGMRLHSIIFSIICSTPFIALGYSKKVDAMIGYLGFQEMLIDVETIQDSDVMKLVDYIKKHKEEIRLKEVKAYEDMKKNEEINEKLLYILLGQSY